MTRGIVLDLVRICGGRGDVLFIPRADTEYAGPCLGSPREPPATIHSDNRARVDDFASDVLLGKRRLTTACRRRDLYKVQLQIRGQRPDDAGRYAV